MDRLGGIDMFVIVFDIGLHILDAASAKYIRHEKLCAIVPPPCRHTFRQYGLLVIRNWPPRF